MSYNYDISTSKKDGHANRGLAVCHTFATVIDLFVSTFLIAHLYSFSNGVYNYCFKAGLFQLIGYACMLVTYFLFSFWVAKTNRIWLYRLAIVMRSTVVIFSVFFGKQIAKYIWLAGMLDGCSKGMYWSSYNVLKQEMVSRTTIKGFSVFTYVLSKCASVVFPVTIGALIEVSTFSQVSIYVLIICAIQLAVSFAVRAHKPENSDFKIPDYLKRLKQNPPMWDKIKDVYKLSMLYGTTSVLRIMMSVCIMIQSGSNLSLGAITSVVAISVITTTILFSKLTKEGKRSWLFIIMSILPIVGSLAFILWPGLATVILFNFCEGISGVFYIVPFDIIRNRDLKEAGLYQDIAEHQAIVEILLCFVRVITYTFVVLLSFAGSKTVFYVILVLSALSYSVNIIATMLYERKYAKQRLQQEKQKEHAEVQVEAANKQD